MLKVKSALFALGLSPFMITALYHDASLLQISNTDEISRSLQVLDATFEASVEIKVSLENTLINDLNEIGTIVGDTFKNNYNTNAELHQDPLQRRIETIIMENATVAPQRFRKLFTASAVYIFKIRAHCRGCPANTMLFVSHKQSYRQSINTFSSVNNLVFINILLLQDNDGVTRKLARHMQSSSNISNSSTSNFSLVSSPSCRKKIRDAFKEKKYLLSAEILSSKNTAKTLNFGETYEECAQGIHEFLDSIKFNLSEKINIVQLKEVIHSYECMSNQQCNKGSICIVNHCLEAGNPLFALIWNGNDGYNLEVRAPDGVTLVNNKYPVLNSLWNVKVITFPTTGGPFGTYIIDVESEDSKETKSSPWKLVAFPGQTDDKSSVIGRGIRSQGNFLFEFKNL
jgi:hypothetical protein